MNQGQQYAKAEMPILLQLCSKDWHNDSSTKMGYLPEFSTQILQVAGSPAGVVAATAPGR